ncbi:MAG: baseplate J/gp47 family protein [Rhodospirillaceae bacterium]|nr:baseplate J/gp47 family protein [Rhodospirillaceae bacterium]
MRPTPADHRPQSHGALLSDMTHAARARFLGAERPWDPVRGADPLAADLGRGLLDCYALALHVLWTYQAIWADEGFLATARLPQSVNRLLALIGFRPHPGIAAAGLQHFRVKARSATTLPPGFRVKAEAEGDKGEAVFETLRAARLDARLNEMRPFLPPAPAAPVDTTGAIALSAELSGVEIAVPTPGDSLGQGPFVDQLGNRLGAGRAGALASRNAQRARQKALQLADTARLLKDAGAADACPATFAQLCEELCAAQSLANEVPVESAPGPLSESQSLLLGQLAKLDARQPDAVVALQDALARQAGESDTDWSRRLDQMASFLDALVSGLLQEARDTVVRLRGSRALFRLDAELGDPAAPSAVLAEDRGVAPPGTDTLYLMPIAGDGETGPATQTALLHPGDWVVVAEDVETVAANGDRTVVRRYREAARIVRLRDEIPAGRREPMTRITVRPALQRRYQLSRTVIVGNIVEISHGETVREAAARLSGDRRTIRPAQDPLTWLADPRAPEGRAPQVAMQVAGQPWLLVDDLRGQAGTAAAFAAEVDAEGRPQLRVGDGVEGAALPAEAAVALQYRVGLGRDGNRDGGSIAKLVAADPAVAETTNPLAITGGVEPEALDDARRTASAGIHTLDRAVSVADIRSLALTFGGVRRAAVFRDPVRRREHLSVVVSGQAGAALADDDRARLRAYLAARVAPGISLTVDNRVPVPLRLQLRLHVTPGADPLAVIRAARQRLGVDTAAGEPPGLLDPDRVELGRDVQLSDIYGALAGLDDLETAFVELFCRTDGPPARNDRVAIAARELPAWAAPSPEIDPIDIRWEEAKDLEP